MRRMIPTFASRAAVEAGRKSGERWRRSMENQRPWVGFDLDGTLARHEGWRGHGAVGAPVPSVVKLANAALDAGVKIKIVTARVSPESLYLARASRADAEAPIRAWCEKHLDGRTPDVTCRKDPWCVMLVDDLAAAVERNGGLGEREAAELLKRMAAWGRGWKPGDGEVLAVKAGADAGRAKPPAKARKASKGGKTASRGR